MKVKEVKQNEGFGGGRSFRVLEIKKDDPIPPGMFQVAEETPVTDWKPEETE